MDVPVYHPTTTYLFYKQPPSVNKKETDLLICSKCLETFASEYKYFKHIFECTEYYRDEMFDYAYYSTNAYLLAQYKLSQLCGAFTNKKFTRCTLCKKSFGNEKELQVHVKTCKKFTDEWKKFELEIVDWAKILTIYQERVYNASTACAECGPWSVYRILVKQDFNTARDQILDALPLFFDALFIRFLEKNKDVANFMSSKDPTEKTVHLAFLKKGKGKEKIGKAGKCENGPQLADDAGDAISNFLDGTDLDDWDGYWNNSEDEECDDDFCDSQDDGG